MFANNSVAVSNGHAATHNSHDALRIKDYETALDVVGITKSCRPWRT